MDIWQVISTPLLQMQKKKKADLKNSSNEVFLEHRRKKKWEDENGYNCFMFYPRSLFITWGHDKKHWDWNCFKETSDENIEVVKLKSVCWFDVRGKLNISNLSAGMDYEIVYVVKLTNGASGWELPITIRLLHPDGRVQERQVSMLEKPKGEWIELNVGKFCADGGSKEVCFDLYEHGGHWKTGLIIKGAIIRPKK